MIEISGWKINERKNPNHESINFLQEFDLKRKRNENIRGITRGILYIN